MSNIILVGFSYTGKSIIARQVARRLGWQAVDTDDMVAAKAGKPVAEIFANEGEWLFRILEKAAISEASFRSSQVISTGGGAAADRVNRRTMRNAGVVICLDAKPETILVRMKESEARNQARTRAHSSPTQTRWAPSAASRPHARNSTTKRRQSSPRTISTPSRWWTRSSARTAP